MAQVKKGTKIIKKEVSNKPLVFMILDGFGLADFTKKGNAITPQTAPNIFSYMKKYPYSTLKAHGKDVGLFAGQEGNSEAGHLNIGAGRIVKQDIVTIWEAIADGRFFKNEAFKQTLHHAKKYKSAVHVMGLLTNGQSAHAHPEHLYALLEFFRRNKQKEVYLHLFTDGRDSPPHAAVKFLKALRKNMKGDEKIASIMGRFYAMDRNKIWERTELAYNTMVFGKGWGEDASAEEAIMQAYNRNETDEYISPTVIKDKDNHPIATIKDNDVIYFFNSRSDRARQLTKVFVQKKFTKMNGGAFKRKRFPKNLRFVAMTDFGPDLPGIFTAFPSPDIDDCLAKVIGEERKQLYISETEKYAHVTFFMNGGFADPINGEDRELVKSTAHVSYANYPQMSVNKISKKIISYINKKKYDFICVNFPNLDMVGHTGNFESTKKAVKIVDAKVKEVVDAVQKKGGEVVIIADHGNAEEMINIKTGEMITEHTTNPVPCIFITDKKGIKMNKGRLSDVAPTLLKIMGLKKSKLMSGKELF
jgi:2,3-bisphosphoglycerate-independent phosphoglycerate mutase